jgi:hypothetical protein
MQPLQEQLHLIGVYLLAADPSRSDAGGDQSAARQVRPAAVAPPVLPELQPGIALLDLLEKFGFARVTHQGGERALS